MTPERRKRETIRKTTREYIIHRDKGLCRYCGRIASGKRWTYWDYSESSGYWRNRGCIDHVVPHSQGGQDHPANLVLACESCNLSKKDKTWHPRPVPK